jgi:hypothetical protein
MTSLLLQGRGNQKATINGSVHGYLIKITIVRTHEIKRPALYQESERELNFKSYWDIYNIFYRQKTSCYISNSHIL